ncbi:MAG: FtsW/RodA/SpoVE family cell cycle protein [Clostridia bacterium]|nr:FtsW/RodA/SpoVE family cell cycle protein [Clostridia bacterium]
MRHEAIKVKKTIDYSLLVIVIAISLFGTYMILSATYYADIFDASNNPLISFIDAFKETAIGLVAMIVAIFIDMKFIKKMAPLLLFLTMGFLMATLFFGTSINGSTRWLRIGPISFAPSEIAKIVAILYFPRVLMHMKKSEEAYQKSWVNVMLFGGITAALIFLQKDLSTMFVYAVILGSLIFVSGAKWKHIIIVFLIGAMLVTAAIVKEPFRLERIRLMFSDDFTLEGDVAQANQSLMAIANGEIIGVGPGRAYQTKNGHSQSESDFIFSTVAETTGFLGSTLLILGYVLMLWRLARISVLSKSTYSALVTTGIMAMIGAQASIHLMVTTKLMPVTGITLPLVSSGGTSTVILLGSIGLALNLSSNPEGLDA